MATPDAPTTTAQSLLALYGALDRAASTHNPEIEAIVERYLPGSTGVNAGWYDELLDFQASLLPELAEPVRRPESARGVDRPAGARRDDRYAKPRRARAGRDGDGNCDRRWLRSSVGAGAAAALHGAEITNGVRDRGAQSPAGLVPAG